MVRRAENVALVPDAAVWLKRLDPSAHIRATPDALVPFAREIEGDRAGAAEAWASLGAPFDEAMLLAQGDEPVRWRAIAILTRLGANGTIARINADLRRE